MDPIRRALAALVWAFVAATPAAVLAASPARPATTLMAHEVRQFASAVIASEDHEGLPFAIVDKKHARLHVYDAGGRLRGTSPVLLGQTPGDGSAVDVGDNTQNGYVPLAQRTTPAGRFVAEPGRNLSGEDVVWVDYDAAFAIHRLRPGRSHAMRVARLASHSPDAKRLSLGCVVVPEKFYLQVVAKLLGEGTSIVYVLPEQGDPAGLLSGNAQRTAAAWREAVSGIDVSSQP